MMKYGLLLLGIAFTSCQRESFGPAPGGNSKEIMMNVSYGTDPAQKMDVYLPAGRSASTTKVLVMIHGGAWSSGDKSDFNQFVDSLQRRLPDYAVFNINYRLAVGTTNLFPTQENDTKAAIEFIYSKRAEYAISDKFVLLGASAGAHLALLQGYKQSSPVKVKAIVDFFGPTDMVDLYNNPASVFIPSSAIAQIMSGTPSTNLSLYQQSSPVNFVTASSAPTIILQGGLDPLVSPAQAIALKTLLQSAGVIHQYVFYPTEMHGWIGPNLVDSFDKIQAFLNANVQ